MTGSFSRHLGDFSADVRWKYIGRFFMAGLAAVTVGALVTGCSPDASIRDDSGRVTAAGEWSVFDLRPGDCFDALSDSDTAGTIPLIPCDQPHTGEVYFVAEYPDTTYPGAAELATWTDRVCLEDLDQQLGLSVADFAFSYLLPTDEGWETNGDRSSVCVLIFDESAPMVGSFVEGTARQ
jgi:hypothetical protein